MRTLKLVTLPYLITLAVIFQIVLSWPILQSQSHPSHSPPLSLSTTSTSASDATLSSSTSSSGSSLSESTSSTSSSTTYSSKMTRKKAYSSFDAILPLDINIKRKPHKQVIIDEGAEIVEIPSENNGEPIPPVNHADHREGGLKLVKAVSDLQKLLH